MAYFQGRAVSFREVSGLFIIPDLTETAVQGSNSSMNSPWTYSVTWFGDEPSKLIIAKSDQIGSIYILSFKKNTLVFFLFLVV